MKKKYGVAIVGVLALLALALPSLVVAQHGDRDWTQDEDVFKMKRHGGPGFGHLEAMRDALELTEEQQEKVDSMRLEHQQQQTRLRGRISATEAELEALMLDPEASRSQVLAAGRELQDLRSQAATQRLEHRMDFRELLTPDQRAELVKMGPRGRTMRGHPGLHGSHGGRGPHHGRGMGLRRVEIEREKNVEGESF